MANTTNGTLAASMQGGIRQDSTPKQIETKKVTRPAAQKQSGFSPYANDFSTGDIYKSAANYYKAGNQAYGDRVLTDYYSQIGNKNSPYYQAQYTYWDEAAGDEQKTLAAESDLLDMYNAVSDAVNKGYSDSWIKNNISAKNYAGLAGLDKDTVLTRQIGYLGDDTVNGMIYAARNPDNVNSGDILAAAGMYGMGFGNSYRPDYKSEAAKDANSEIYHPYMQGNHATGEAAEANTAKAKAELERFQQTARKRLEAGEDAESVYNTYFGNGARYLNTGSEDEEGYPTLYQMEYDRERKAPMELSEDVDFAAPYVKQWLYDQQAEIAQAKTDAADAERAELIAQQSASFIANVPEEYQEAVLALYAYDKGITREEDVNEQSYAELDSWLNENGLIGKEDFGQAYNDATAKLVHEWSERTQASDDFTPAAFIVDGENADPELNVRQVRFQNGMQDYLAGRPVVNSDTKAFLNRYGFLFNDYTVKTPDLSLGGILETAKTATVSASDLERRAKYGLNVGADAQHPIYGRMNVIGSALDAELDKLDAAWDKGEITDEEYFNCYLEIGAMYDNFKASGSDGTFGDYIHDTYGEDKTSLESEIIGKIDQRITVGKENYDREKAAYNADVSLKFGEWERSSNNGDEVADPTFTAIRSIEINPKSFRGMDAAEYDPEYSVAYNYALDTFNSAEYGTHYNSSYADLAAYDVAEVVNDIMRLAQYTETDFATARKAMGFETYEDLEDYLYNYNYTVNKKCSDILETMYDVGNKLLKADKGSTAEDLLESGVIDQETFDKFRSGIGNDTNEATFYERIQGAQEGKNGRNYGVAAATRVYKDAMSERKPEPDKAYGYSSSVTDIVANGASKGWVMHQDAWVMAALGFADMTPAERENKARYDYNNNPQMYRRVLELAIQDVDDENLRNAYMNQLNNYQGDIFKFNFNTNVLVGELNDAHRSLNNKMQALDEEMMSLLTPVAYEWYNNMASATNSTILSAEAILITNALTLCGMAKPAAALMGQMLTTAPVEGGETAYKLKQAGVSSGIADLTGVLSGMATALSEYGLEGLVQKGMYKTPFARRLGEFGKINTAGTAMRVQEAMISRGAGKTTTWLATNGTRSILGALNWIRGTAIGTAGEILQEAQQQGTTEGAMWLAGEYAGVGGGQFLSSGQDYLNLAKQTGGSAILQTISPLSVGPAIINTVNNTIEQKSFAKETKQTADEMKARGTAEVGTAQAAVDATLAEIKSATAEREAAMNNLKAVNAEALVDQETVTRLAEPALELKNSELTGQIDDLTAKKAQLHSQLDNMVGQRDEATARAEEARTVFEQGDNSKEALKNLTDTTNIVRALDISIDQANADIKANDEQLAKLKEEKQNARKAAYDAARQQAIESVTDEMLADETAKREAEVERTEKMLEEAKAKHEAAKSKAKATLDAYQEELKGFEARTRAKAAAINAGSEDTVISDGLIDVALGISNEMRNIDVAQATAHETSIKESLVKQLELSFPGYKVEMRSLGKGNHGKVVMNGEQGTIIVNSDSSSFELMNGELGYELAQMAQTDRAGYKPLYDAVTTAVYGGVQGTQVAYSAAVARLVSEGVTADVTKPNNAYDQAGSEVFAEAIGRLLSGEFKNSKWVQSISNKAPEFAGNIYDWIAMRTKEFKTMAKHGSKQAKAQYNEIVNVLKQFSETLNKATTEDFNGQTVEVDTTPIAIEEAHTDNVSDFVDGLVENKPVRYTGQKRLPVFEVQADGTYAIDRTGLTTEENDLISEVEKAGMQAEYNALNGEVTAESVFEELVAATAQESTALTTMEDNVLEGEVETETADTYTNEEEIDQRISEIEQENIALERDGQNDRLNENNQELEWLKRQKQAAREANRQDNTEENSEDTESTALTPEQQRYKEARTKMLDGLLETLSSVNDFDEETQKKILGKVRGIIHNVFNGDRSRSTGDASNTPLAILKALADNIGATLYQNVPLGQGVTTELQSFPGFIHSKKLFAQDINALVETTADHVLNQIEHDGTGTNLSNDREVNFAMLKSWMLNGISDLRDFVNFDSETMRDFGDKLRIALTQSKDGRTILKALNEAKQKLSDYYNADFMRQVGAYIRSKPESTPSGKTNWWTKFKADWFGNDVVADMIDKVTHYQTNLRRRARYTPYAQGISNMWVGDNEAAHGFVDLNGDLVEGAKTLHEAIMAPFKKVYYELHRKDINRKLNVLLALQSAYDRYERGQPVFSEYTSEQQDEVAEYLGITGHPTMETIRAAIDELSQDSRLVEAAEGVREWWRNIMKLAVSEGVVSQELYDQFQEENPNYAPLQRDMSTLATDGQTQGRTSETTAGDLVADGRGIRFRKAKGNSDRAISDPLVTFTDMAQAMADKLISNYNAREFARAYDLASYDSIGVFGSEISNGQADVMHGRGADNVLNVYYEDGTHRSFIVNNPELLDLLLGRKVSNNIKGINAVGWFTRKMAALTTSNNPLFAIANALRDYQTSVNYGSWASNYVTGLPKWIAAFAECMAYSFSKEWNKLINNSNKGVASQQLADFLQRGGEGFTRRSLTTQHKNDSVEAVMGENWAARTLDAGKHLITFNTVNDAVEMASRYVEYKFGKNETRNSKNASDQSKFNAFMESREATVDFAQVGTGKLAWVTRQLIPFFNATLQGWYRTGRMFSEAERSRLPARLTKTILNTTISGALSAASCLFGGMVFGGEDEDWDEQANEYWKVSDDMRRDYILLPLSGFGIISNRDLVRIPLLQDGLGEVCYNMGRQAVESIYKYLHGEDVQISAIAGDMWGLVKDIVLEPVQKDTIFTPYHDIKENNTFYDTQLVSDYLLEKYDPGKWGNQTTGKVFFQASNAYRRLVEAFGKTPNDLLSSPAGMEYLLKEYSGIIGQLLIPTITRDRYSGEETGFINALSNTVKNRFSLDAESTNDISTNYTKGKEYLEHIANLDENDMGIAPLSALLTSDERLEAKAEAKAANKKGGILKDIDEGISELWSQYNEIMANPDIDADEKTAAAEAIRKQINALQQEGIDYILDYQKRWAADMNFIEAALDGWEGATQTLLDEGPGLASKQKAQPAAEQPTASTNPADLPVAQAGMPDLGSLTQTLPYIGEESENVQAPLTSPDYTGERVRGVTTEYTSAELEAQRKAEAYRNGRNVFTETNRQNNTGDTTINFAAKSEYRKAKQAKQDAFMGEGIREKTPVVKQAEQIAPAKATPAKAEPTEQAATTYNVASNTQNVTSAFTLKRDTYGDTLSGRKIKELYGDNLPDSYYNELSAYMSENYGSDLLPTPQASFRDKKIDYNLTSYSAEVQSEFLNWFADEYIAQYMYISQQPEYINGTQQERLELFTKVRKNARAKAKANFLAKYVK